MEKDKWEPITKKKEVEKGKEIIGLYSLAFFYDVNKLIYTSKSQYKILLVPNIRTLYAKIRKKSIFFFFYNLWKYIVKIYN